MFYIYMSKAILKFSTRIHTYICCCDETIISSQEVGSTVSLNSLNSKLNTNTTKISSRLKNSPFMQVFLSIVNIGQRIIILF